jgi:hypothetical protein
MVVRCRGFSHFLDKWLIDGGEVVSLTRRPRITHKKIPGDHFCQRLSKPLGHGLAGKKGKLKNPISGLET